MTKFKLFREDRSPNHPTGWVLIGKHNTLEQAVARADSREANMRRLYSGQNRLYHLIEGEQS